MTLTKDQKHALYIGGGVAALIVIYYLTRSSGAIIPTAVAVPDAGSFDATSPPGYTTYNVQPLDIPAPGVCNAIAPKDFAGCGCVSRSDGCFTSNPLANGDAALSIAQLIADYGASFAEFAGLVKSSQEGYALPAPTLAQMTTPPGSYNPLFDFSKTAPQRLNAFYSTGGFGNNSYSPSVNGW